MKLFTAQINKQLFAQYHKGSDLMNQKVVAKIFNPYGRGTWYIINSDPDDPDYLWAIVNLFDVEVGSVSRKELESLLVPPFRLHLERDISFTPINAQELLNGLYSGKHYAKGGTTSFKPDVDVLEAEDGSYYLFPEDKKADTHGVVFKNGGRILSATNRDRNYKSDESWEQSYKRKSKPKNPKYQYAMKHGGEVENDENGEMLKNQVTNIIHHANELDKISNNAKDVEPWVITKAQRSVTDLADITHYLEGESKKMADGGMMDESVDLFEDYENIPDNVQNILDKYSEAFEDGDYAGLGKAKKALKKIGYTFDYDLDGQAYGLRKMAMGGETFEGKVKSIKSSLLSRKKVSPSVQKDYGKTYSPKEAEESAKRIVGAMTARERMKTKMRSKKSK